VRNDVVLVLVVITALAFDFTNGFHHTGNAMATSIATGALPPRVAVALSGLLNLVGAFLSLAVAATIASGLVNTNEITLQVVAAGLWPSPSTSTRRTGPNPPAASRLGVSQPPSVRGADELVEPRHRLAPRHRDRIAPGVTPCYPS
jgi:Phosphate transporter family